MLALARSPAEVHSIMAAQLAEMVPPGTGSPHGSWWQKHLPNARLEMAPDAGHLLVIPLWRRVLSHLAPARR